MTGLYIIEGARGVGKSTVVRKLRDAMTNTLAINFTGNNGDSEEAKDQTLKHYDNWLSFFSYEVYDKSPMSYIFDRFFFSEMVYSKLYKEYDFTQYYESLLKRLDLLGIEVTIIHLQTGVEDLRRNLSREGKAHLFNSDKFADDTHKSVEQMIEYDKLFAEVESKTKNIKVHSIDCTNMSLDEVVMCVKHLVR